MGQLTVRNTSKLGAVLTLTAAASAGDYFLNDGRCVLIVRNASLTLPRTVTLPAEGRAGEVEVDNVVLVVAALGIGILGPFPPRYFNNGSGQLNITYSDAAADLTVAVVRW